MNQSGPTSNPAPILPATASSVSSLRPASLAGVSFSEQMRMLRSKLEGNTLDATNPEDKYLLKRAAWSEKVLDKNSEYELEGKHKNSFIKVLDSKANPEKKYFKGLQAASLDVLSLREEKLNSPTSLARARKIFGGEITSKTRQLEKDLKDLKEEYSNEKINSHVLLEINNRALKDLRDAETWISNYKKEITLLKEEIIRLEKNGAGNDSEEKNRLSLNIKIKEEQLIGLIKTEASLEEKLKELENTPKVNILLDTPAKYEVERKRFSSKELDDITLEHNKMAASKVKDLNTKEDVNEYTKEIFDYLVSYFKNNNINQLVAERLTRQVLGFKFSSDKNKYGVVDLSKSDTFAFSLDKRFKELQSQNKQAEKSKSEIKIKAIEAKSIRRKYDFTYPILDNIYSDLENGFGVESFKDKYKNVGYFFHRDTPDVYKVIDIKDFEDTYSDKKFTLQQVTEEFEDYKKGLAGVYAKIKSLHVDNDDEDFQDQKNELAELQQKDYNQANNVYQELIRIKSRVSTLKSDPTQIEAEPQLTVHLPGASTASASDPDTSVTSIVDIDVDAVETKVENVSGKIGKLQIDLDILKLDFKNGNIKNKIEFEEQLRKLLQRIGDLGGEIASIPVKKKEFKEKRPDRKTGRSSETEEKYQERLKSWEKRKSENSDNNTKANDGLRKLLQDIRLDVLRALNIEGADKKIESSNEEIKDKLNKKRDEIRNFLRDFEAKKKLHKDDKKELGWAKDDAHAAIVQFRVDLSKIKTDFEEINTTDFTEEQLAEHEKNKKDPDPEKYPMHYRKLLLLKDLKDPEKEVGPNVGDKQKLEATIDRLFMDFKPTSKIVRDFDPSGKVVKKSANYTEEEKSKMTQKEMSTQDYREMNKLGGFDSPILNVMRMLEANTEKYKDRNFWKSDSLSEEEHTTIQAQINDVKAFVDRLRDLENIKDPEYLKFKDSVMRALEEPSNEDTVKLDSLGLGKDKREILKRAMNLDRYDGGIGQKFATEAQDEKHKVNFEGRLIVDSQDKPILERGPIRSRLMSSAIYDVNGKKIGGGFGMSSEEVSSLINNFKKMTGDMQEKIIKTLDIETYLKYNRESNSILGAADILLNKKSNMSRAWNWLGDSCSQIAKNHAPFMARQFKDTFKEKDANFDSAIDKLFDNSSEMTTRQKNNVAVAAAYTAYYVSQNITEEKVIDTKGFVYNKTPAAIEAERKGEKTFMYRFMMSDGTIQNKVFSKDEYENIIKPNIKKSPTYTKRVTNLLNNINPFWRPNIN